MSNNNMTVVSPNRENASTVQINNLLQVIAVLSHTAKDSETQEGGKLDGGTKLAVETSIISACNRLDSILGDTARWDVAEYASQSAAMQKMYDENTRLITAQRAAYEDATSPHAKYHPQLVRLSNGKWLAISGNLHDIENAVCGLGECPADAVQAFDDMFRGKVNDKVEALLQQDKNEKAKQPVDGIGNEQTPGIEKPRRKRRGHSLSDGEVPPLGNE